MSKNLKQWRNATGLSQTEVAKKIGVTKQTLYKWERGMSPVAVVHWVKYAQLLGIDTDTFEDALIETLLAYALETLDPQVLRVAQISGKYDALKLKSAIETATAAITAEPNLQRNESTMNKDLAYYRKRKGISQEEMGEYLSVPKANISAWENGTRGIPLKHFDKIAKLLDLTEDELQNTLAHSPEKETASAVPEIVGELAQKIYDKAWERAKLRQNVLREKFMEQLKQTYAGFTEEEYQEILYSLIKDEISPILIRGEISRMTSSIAFLAHEEIKEQKQ